MDPRASGHHHLLLVSIAIPRIIEGPGTDPRTSKSGSFEQRFTGVPDSGSSVKPRTFEKVLEHDLESMRTQRCSDKPHTSAQHGPVSSSELHARCGNRKSMDRLVIKASTVTRLTPPSVHASFVFSWMDY